jgi:hypothetical protein
LQKILCEIRNRSFNPQYGSKDNIYKFDAHNIISFPLTSLCKQKLEALSSNKIIRAEQTSWFRKNGNQNWTRKTKRTETNYWAS